MGGAPEVQNKAGQEESDEQERLRQAVGQRGRDAVHERAQSRHLDRNHHCRHHARGRQPRRRDARACERARAL